MSWIWVAVGGWLALAAVVALCVGAVIARADREQAAHADTDLDLELARLLGTTASLRVPRGGPDRRGLVGLRSRPASPLPSGPESHRRA